MTQAQESAKKTSSTQTITIELWELFVPTIRNNGKPIRTRFHRVWDKKVSEITGGLTIMAPMLGKWKDPNNGISTERMIPVRIAGTLEQIESVVSMTLKYYEQECVMAYRIADQVIMRYKDGTGNKKPGSAKASD